MSGFSQRFFRDFIKKIQNFRIAVIGDSILDQYYYGEVCRISPEAPVPINHVQDIKSILGGASNVASNLANLGCKVYLGTVSGDDVNFDILTSLLEKENINHSGLIKSFCRPTISKVRVLGMGQQMIRLDFEKTDDLDEVELSQLKKWFSTLLKEGIDGVLLSDYAKGMCSSSFCSWVIAEAKKQGILILVDPKGKNWLKYSGCDFITPNVKELSDVLGYTVKNEDEAIVSACKEIKKLYPIQNIVVTRSEKGLTLVGDTILHSPAVKAEVFDVTGCGDTVAAVMLVSSLYGLSYKEALELCNLAAGIVITKVGTYPIHRDDLVH